MTISSSSSDFNAPNFTHESISDEDLIRGFILALGAGGRKVKTLTIYEDSIRMLSDFWCVSIRLAALRRHEAARDPATGKLTLAAADF